MLELIKLLPDQLWTIVSVLIGGLISVITGYVAQRITDRRTKNELLMKRLEEVYGASQSVFDGHKARLSWLATRDKIGKDEWENRPKYPGFEMSRMKMLICSYAADLEPSIDVMNASHQWFKDLDLGLSMRFGKADVLIKGTDYDVDTIKEQLDLLGDGTAIVKQGVTKRLKAYFG